MEYAEIMREMTSALTGDWANDKTFLLSQYDKYKEHPLSLEINRTVGRLLYDCIPDDQKKKLDTAISNDEHYRSVVIAEAQEMIRNRAFDEAEKLILSILPSPENELFQNDTETLYLSLNNTLEAIYYQHMYEPEQKLRKPPYPFNELYQIYAYLLIEKQEFDTALSLLARALTRSPLNTWFMFERAEIYKFMKDMNTFLELTKLCLPYIYTRSELARYFRNLGFYFIENELWDEAICAYQRSIQWEATQMAQSQLFYIVQKTGKVVDRDVLQDAETILGRHCISCEPEMTWLKIAWQAGLESFNSNDFESAAFYLNVVFQMSGYEEAEAKLLICMERLKDTGDNL